MQAVDAYAIIGDIAGFAEKIQSFFLQEALSGTHSVLKEIVQEVFFIGTHIFFILLDFIFCHFILLMYLHFDAEHLEGFTKK